MNRRDQIKNYQTEGYSFHYLRPRDFSDDDGKKKNTNIRTKVIPKNYNFQKNNKNEEEEDRAKSEKAALALMRIRQAQEKKRKK